MGSKITPGFIIIIVFFIMISQSMVDCVNYVGDLDDLIRSYASGDQDDTRSRRQHTGSLYEIPLPSNLSDIKASFVTLRNSVFWRRGANFSGIHIPSMVKTTPYAKRIAFIYESFGVYSSSVYFRLTHDYSFVSPVIGFTVYDATNTNDLQKLNVSIKRDKPILIKLVPYYISHDDHRRRRRIKCIAFEANGILNFTDTIRNYECSTTNSNGHYALVILNKKNSEDELVIWRKWWFALTAIGISILVVAFVIVVVVKLVKKKKFRSMERESEKSEMVRNVWVGRSRMPAATVIRTQPCLEYHEDLPSSSSSIIH